jgi:2-C-methyl-D-erythritol 4-phosphate cytidylyltransferase
VTLIAAIVPAAGSGERLGAGVPKALALLAGEPILAHAIRALVAEPRVGLVVVAAPPGLESQMERTTRGAAGGVPVRVVTGGATRVASVSAALALIPTDVAVVLVHDAARALVPGQVVAAVADAVLAGAPAAVPAVAVVDTVRRVGADGSSETLDRATLRAVQTPQGFSADVLRAAHARTGSTATDDAGMVESLGHPVTLVEGDYRAFKVTTRMDLLLAEALLADSGEAS